MYLKYDFSQCIITSILQKGTGKIIDVFPIMNLCLFEDWKISWLISICSFFFFGWWHTVINCFGIFLFYLKFDTMQKKVVMDMQLLWQTVGHFARVGIRENIYCYETKWQSFGFFFQRLLDRTLFKVKVFFFFFM